MRDRKEVKNRADYTLRWLYIVFWRARHGYENGAIARSLKLVLIKTNTTKWLPAILQNLCLVFLYVISHKELFSKMCRQNCFLCVDLMKKILSFIKLLIFLRFGRNVYQASIDGQKRMKAEKVAVVVGGRGVVQGLC